jgi:membrane-associated phospholipid phosphatase
VRALPEPSDLRVAPLVRRERRIEEGQPSENGQRHSEQRAERWGPPRERIDRLTAAIAALAFAAAFGIAVATSGLALSPDRYLLVLLAPAIVIRRARRYLLDFLPFGLLLVLYSESRGIAHLLHPHPYYLPQLDAEKFLFGGHVPSVWLQQHFWDGDARWHDRLILEITRLHFVVPPFVAFAFWLRRRALFYRFAASMLTLSFAGAITFYLYPAAPPWAASQAGLLGEVTKLTDAHPAVSGVPVQTHGSFSISRLIDPNPYAAIPSLHGGYAFLVFLFLAALAWRTPWRRVVVPLAALYPLLQSFAVVYTGNHYVVDLLIGFAYATASVLAVDWFWRRRGWPR